MLIGIDDTDSPQGMCTTYLGAVLARRLIKKGMRICEARLVRLNPNVTYKTRGNAAIALRADGDCTTAFDIACHTVEELADFACENTNPGVVVVEDPPDPAFYWKAVRDFCEIDEAVEILDSAGALFRGYKNRTGPDWCNRCGSKRIIRCNLRDPDIPSSGAVGHAPRSDIVTACLLQKRRHFRIRGTPWMRRTVSWYAYRIHRTRCCLASGARARLG